MNGCTLRIGELLRERNMTQADLVRLTGITKSAISHYVSGDRIPRGMNLVKIAEALKVSTDELLCSDNTESKDKDLSYAKLLIARNASEMTKEERREFIELLMG